MSTIFFVATGSFIAGYVLALYTVKTEHRQ